MKRVLFTAIGLVVATALLGAWLMTLDVDVTANPAARLANWISLGVVPWPFVYPLVAGAFLAFKATWGLRKMLTARLDKSNRLAAVGLIMAPGFALLFQSGVALVHFGVVDSAGLARIVLIATCLLVIGLGNYAASVRRGSGLGLKTPWTRGSAKAWVKTHRLFGRGAVAVALAALALIVFVDASIGSDVLKYGLLGVTAFSILYSYLIWRRDPDRAV